LQRILGKPHNGVISDFLGGARGYYLFLGLAGRFCGRFGVRLVAKHLYLLSFVMSDNVRQNNMA